MLSLVFCEHIRIDDIVNTHNQFKSGPVCEKFSYSLENIFPQEEYSWYLPWYLFTFLICCNEQTRSKKKIDS